MSIWRNKRSLSTTTPAEQSRPNYWNLDASLIKNVRISETTRLQLRMEAFNALNNVNFLPSLQQLDIANTNFGRLTQVASQITGGARVLQFAARFEF